MNRPSPLRPPSALLATAVVVGAAVAACTHGASHTATPSGAATVNASPGSAAALGSSAAAPATTPVYTGPPRITGISPPAGLPGGGNTVHITGQGLERITRVRFGSTVGRNFHRVSATDLSVTVPAHSAGSVHVQVRSRRGTSTYTAADRYRFTLPPPPQTWTTTVADPARGDLGAISCPTATFCAAVDGSNNLLTRTGDRTGTWQRQTVPPAADDPLSVPEFNVVSCASPTFCVASAGFAGSVVDGTPGPGTLTYRFDGTSWSELGRFAVQTLSCVPGTKRCIGSTAPVDPQSVPDEWFTVQNSTVTRHVFSASPQFTDMSCASVTFCVGATHEAAARTFNGTSWGEGELIRPVDNSPLVSCGAPQSCVLIDHDGRAGVRTASGWREAVRIDRERPTDLSCVGPSACVLLDAKGRYLTYDGTWSSPKPTGFRDVPLSVSCFAVNRCRGTDDTGAVYSFDGTTWSGPETVEPDAGRMTDVSCASRSMCMAVDASGSALRWNGTTWGAPQQIAEHHALAGVSCPTDTFCLAVDGDFLGGDPNGTPRTVPLGIMPTSTFGLAATFNGTSWSPPVTADPDQLMTSVDCATSTFCVAVDSAGNALTYRSGHWSAPKSIDPSGGLTDVSCPTTTFCLAIDQSDAAFRFDGTVWQVEATPWHSGTLDATSIDCTSPSYCVLGAAVTEIRNGTTWRVVDVPFDQVRSTKSIACADPTFCLGTSVGFDYLEPRASFAFDGAAARPFPPTVFTGELTCTADRFCVAINGDQASTTQ